MKKKKIFLLLSALVFSSCLVTEDDVVKEDTPKPLEKKERILPVTVDEKYSIDPTFNFNGTIATWYQFKQAANSVTFDDGTIDQYAVAFPELEKMGIKGTFYLIANLIDQGYWDDHGTTRKMMSWINASRIAAAGHEIGSHSMNHYDMSISEVDIERELHESRDYIELKLPDVRVETFCWPHWRESTQAVEKASLYYISARSGNGLIDYYLNRKGGIPSDPPFNMFKVNALGFMNDQREEEWKEVINKTYENHSWFVSSYHGVNNGKLPEDNLGWSPISTEKFVQTLKYPYEMGFWMDTFANVSKYIYERDSAVLHIKNKGFSLELTLDDNLDDMVYNQKISISFDKPKNWSNILIFNHIGEKIPFEESENTVFLDIYPNGNTIEIKPLLTVEN